MGITRSPTNRSATARDSRKKLVAFCSFLSSDTARMTRMFPPIVGMMTIMISRAAHFSWTPGTSADSELLVSRGNVIAGDMVLQKLHQVLVLHGALLFLMLDTWSAWLLGPKGKDTGRAGHYAVCFIPCAVHKLNEVYPILTAKSRQDRPNTSNSSSGDSPNTRMSISQLSISTEEC